MKFSTSLNKYYVKVTKNGISAEGVVDGDTGVFNMSMYGRCTTQASQKFKVSAMIALIKATY
jgi:hypothetical protein